MRSTRRLIWVVFTLALTVASPVRTLAEDTVSDFRHYEVDAKHRFVQVELTQPLLDRVLALMPQYAKLQTELANEQAELFRSDKNGWDMAVSQIQNQKAGAARMTALLAQQNFPPDGSFERAMMSIMLVADPEGVEKLGKLSFDTLSTLKGTGNFSLMPPGVVAAMERNVSLAQQEPITANLVFLSPMKASLMARIKSVETQIKSPDQ